MIVDRPTRWIATAVFAGLAYIVIGLAFGEMAGRAGSHQGTVAWRFAAWIASGLIYVAQMAREIRRGESTGRTAWHAAIGAAIGSFGLAVAATLHALWVPAPEQHFQLFLIALVAWPIGTLIPAYLVGLVVSAVLRRLI